MGKQREQAPAAAATPAETEATDAYEPSPHEGEVRKLLGGHTNEMAVAWIVASYPIYEVEFMMYLQHTYGNAYSNSVMDLVDVVREAAANNPSPEMTDHSAGVQGRGWLAGDVGSAAMARDAPAPKDALPYDGMGGWNAVVINTKLGQMDKIAATNSDGDRCAFATALAAHIFAGPAAVASWAHDYVTEQLEGSAGGERRGAAKGVVTAVSAAILGGTATYGDLSWMQEALHDLAVADHAGTKTSKDVITKNEQYTDLAGVACTTAAQVKAAAKDLAPGDRIMVEWHATRGLADKIEHQLMLYNDGGVLYLYDPQPDAGGVHLTEVSKAGCEVYFNTAYSESKLVMAGKVSAKSPAPT